MSGACDVRVDDILIGKVPCPTDAGSGILRLLISCPDS